MTLFDRLAEKYTNLPRKKQVIAERGCGKLMSLIIIAFFILAFCGASAFFGLIFRLINSG